MIFCDFRGEEILFVILGGKEILVHEISGEVFRGNVHNYFGKKKEENVKS